MHAIRLSIVLLISACANGPATDLDGGGRDGGKVDESQVPRDAGPDPFAAQIDESAGLVNVSSDIHALLEHGALAGACDAYAAAPTDRRAMLLCGKEMFFYESFGTAGVPERLLHYFAAEFPDEIGEGFSRYGMIPDPYSDRSHPIGFGPTKPLGPLSIDAVSYTCASCHVGRLPDGRYAVGMPNHDYEYGRQILTLFLTPALFIPFAEESDHHPDAVAAIRPVRDRLDSSLVLKAKLAVALLPLIGQTPASLRTESEGFYANWKSGTMDFIIDPLPLDDGVHIISKISALWGIPRPEEFASYGMTSAMLGWNGNMHTVLRLALGFVALGGGDVDAWPADRLAPLVEYVYSLRTPDNLAPPDPSAAERGRTLLVDAGCLACHQGPRGSGVRMYRFDEIGTDNALERWLDPDLTGHACCGVDDPLDEYVTNGLKSPRLTGVWAFRRFLHNGSVDSLEALLCVDGPRGQITEPAYRDGGHSFGCDLGEADKRDLIAFLRSI